MNKHTIFIALFVLPLICNAQLIKNSFGQAALDEKTVKVLADPSKRQPGYRYGFTVDLEFAYGLEPVQKNNYLVQVEKLDIKKDLGYFNQNYSDKTGRYYPCSNLENNCETSELIDIVINATWEYNGQQFKTGAITMPHGRNDRNFLKKPIEIFLPGGNVIPVDAVKSKTAKVVNIEVVSWSSSKDDQIMEIIRKSK